MTRTKVNLLLSALPCVRQITKLLSRFEVESSEIFELDFCFVFNCFSGETEFVFP